MILWQENSLNGVNYGQRLVHGLQGGWCVPINTFQEYFPVETDASQLGIMPS